MKTEIIYGFHPVFEGLKAARRKFIEVYTVRDKTSERIQQVAALAESMEIAVKKIKTSQLNQLAGNMQHQGVGAKVSAYPLVDMSLIIDKGGSANENRFLALLDNVLDPQNLGAIIRTTLAVGVDGVIIPKDRSASPTPAVSKASAGALEHMCVAAVTNMVNTLRLLKGKGIWVFGMDKAAKESIFTADLRGSLAIVIGGEEKGIRPLVKQHCDYLVSIPQRGSIDSLNASAAAAVAMYEVFRQRTV